MEKGVAISTASAADPAVKKLYRACVECVKLLEQGMKGKPTPHSLANLTPIRKRLRDCCEKLMFLNPLEFGHKADEMLWRKCHYEPIKGLRQHSEALGTESKCMLNTMLMSAIGYYQVLQMKLQNELVSDSSAVSDFPMPVAFWTSKDEKRTEKSKKLEDWCIEERHRIFVYQGDLARYLHEIDDSVSYRVAEHYYYQALALKPSHGTPHNQLGTLTLLRNYGLDAAYHYLRSVSSEENFSGAEGNLFSLLSKNESLLQELLSESEKDNEESLISGTSCEKYFALVFLATARLMLLDESDKNDGGAIQAACGRTLRTFCAALQQRTVDLEANVATMSALDNNSVLELLVIQMLIIDKLQKKGSLKLSPAIALLLSMFSNFLPLIVEGFFNDLAMGCSEVTTNGRKISDKGEITPMIQARRNSAVMLEAKRSDQTKTNSSKRARLRKRRRGDKEEEDGFSEAGTDEISSQSSVESESGLAGHDSTPPSLSSSGSDDIVELSDDDELSIANLVERNGKGKSTSLAHGEAVADVQNMGAEIEQKPWLELSPKEKIDILMRRGFLVPVKIVCDWFRSNPNFLVLVQQNARDLWSSLARVLNFLPDDRELAGVVANDPNLSVDFEDNPVLSLNDWMQKFALPEDVMLRGAGPFKQIHSGLDFTRMASNGLQSEAVARICCLRSFGHYLIRMNTPLFRFDRARLEFIASKGKAVIQDSTESDKKHALMRSMAQLRLKTELAAAEEVAWIPVYLVPDVLALCYKLPVIKRLASAQKFITVIPTTTINELDRLKKDSGPARSATRWLETQFSRGNKFVRIQKSTESVISSSLDESIATYELPGNFLEILKCAAQLRKSVKAGTVGGSTIVTILSNYAIDSREHEKINQALQSPDLTGVTVTNVSHFCKLWDSHRKRAP